MIWAWFFQTLATDYPTGTNATGRGSTDSCARPRPWLQGPSDPRRPVGRMRHERTPTYDFKTEAWYQAATNARSGRDRRLRRAVEELPGLGRRGRGPLQGRPDGRVLAADERGRGHPAARSAPARPVTGHATSSSTSPTDVSGLVKSIDPQPSPEPGTIGSGQCGSRARSTRTSTRSHIDLCEYHDYTPNEAVPGDQWNGLGVRIQQCAALGKPFFVGEAGIRPIDAGGTREDRADALRAKFDVADCGRASTASSPGTLADRIDARQLRHRPGRPVLRICQCGRGVDGIVYGQHDRRPRRRNSATATTATFGRRLPSRTLRDHNSCEVIAFDIPGPGPAPHSPTTPLARDHRPRDRSTGRHSRVFRVGSPDIVLSGALDRSADGLRIAGAEATYVDS